MKLKKGSAAAKAFMAKIRAKRKKTTKVGAAKKTAKKKAVKKVTRLHKDSKSHNVRISVVSGNIKYSPDEIKFLETESKHSKGYKYRAKILFGQIIVLKETEAGTPVKKWIVDDMEVASSLAKDLNNSYKLSKVKSKKI